MKIEVTKLKMIVDAKEEYPIQLVDYLNKPGYDVTIEHIGKTIITIEKKDIHSSSINGKKYREDW